MKKEESLSKAVSRKKNTSYLTYIEDAGKIKDKRGTVLLVKCLCICGNKTIVRKPHFLSKHTKSCGCYKKELIGKLNRTHGLRKTRTYRCWFNMKTRCNNKNTLNFKDYGGRGITVCDEWINSFEIFLENMGVCPSNNHSIDRIDVNGNYCKENCKWSTIIEQNNNKRNNIKYIFNGEMLNVTQISILTKIPRSSISSWRNKYKYTDKQIHDKITKEYEARRIQSTKTNL